MNIGGRPQNKSSRAQIKIAFVPLIISSAEKWSKSCRINDKNNFFIFKDNIF